MALRLQRTTTVPSSTNGENLEQWDSFAGVASLPKLLQEYTEQHVKNCKAHLPQL